MPTLTPVDFDPFASPSATERSDWLLSQGRPMTALDASPLMSVVRNPDLPIAARAAAAVPIGVTDTIGNMARTAWSGATLPGDVYAGRIDSTSPEGIARVQDLAAFAAGGSPLKAGIIRDIDSAKVLQSKVVPGYNAPMKPPRPFEADYPAGAASDERGNLATDIEGRPLTAQFIAGRRSIGGADMALGPADIRSVGTGAGTQDFRTVPTRDLRGQAGRLVGSRNPETGSREWDIRLNNTLSPGQLDRTAAHEVGHLIDEVVGQIPTQGLSRELSQIYNTLNTDQRLG